MNPPRQGQVRVAPVAQMTPTCTPKYPKAALQAEVTGTTGLAMLVNEAGRVTRVRIVESSGDTPVHKLLDLVTTTAIWDCPFTAGTLDGQPSTMWARIQYVWRIE
jgi:periplasmic protein TonB